MEFENIKSKFPIFKQKINGKPLIYLDSANSSQKPKTVIDEMSRFYETEFSNVGRSVHTLAVKATNKFEDTRDIVKSYINAKHREEIIFTKGATEAINLVASTYGEKFIKAGDEILVTELEHHSNYVPWHYLRKKKGAVIKFASVDENGEINIDEFKKKITEKTKMITFTHISNVTGTIMPVKKIVDLARSKNIPVLIDGTQGAPHSVLDVQDLGCDFYAISCHKMYGPNGLGILYAKKAEAYLKKTGIGDKSYFGPEPEFFVFDDVRFKNDMNETSFSIDSSEGPYNTGKKYENGNMGHRPGIKGGYFPVPPVDSAQDMRGEYLKALKDMGVKVEKHHHEVAPSQHELGMYFGTLTNQADNVQLYKYAVQMVTHSFGKTATFMPKPVKGDNGSGMHCHQSIWKGNTPVFMGKEYAGLSKQALYYIGGILKHARAINAFSNATTNSYKRLIPGFEAPVILAYSARNRSASCRIPVIMNPKAARMEIRFPDAAGNPYLTFASMLMAGIDGIKNKIDPGKAFDQDLYSLSEDEVKKLPTVCGSLREAMQNLDKDRKFLTEGGVFTDDQIDAYIELKFQEIYNFEHTPHPIEFEMYYSG